MEEKRPLTVVRKGILRPVTTVIPEQVITEEVEVDTLQEFLNEIKLTKDQLLIAVKMYKDDKVTQPSYDMSDVIKKIEVGKQKAKSLIESTEKRLEILDIYVSDALIASKKWKCTGKISKKYILERVS